MARSKSPDRGIVKGATLEPIRVVKRTLTRPDGTTVSVDVPVYPPFRLEDRAEKRSPAPGKRRDPRKRPERKTG